MAPIAFRVALVLVYLASTVIAVIALDADSHEWQTDLWLGMSLLLGAGARDLRFVGLPFVAVAIAVPFGNPAGPADPVLPLWIVMLYWSMFASFLVILATLLGMFVESRLRKT